MGSIHLQPDSMAKSRLLTHRLVVSRGTLTHSAPEMLDINGALGSPADVWMLAATTLELHGRHEQPWAEQVRMTDSPEFDFMNELSSAATNGPKVRPQTPSWMLIKMQIQVYSLESADMSKFVLSLPTHIKLRQMSIHSKHSANQHFLNQIRADIA